MLFFFHFIGKCLKLTDPCNRSLRSNIFFFSFWKLKVNIFLSSVSLVLIALVIGQRPQKRKIKEEKLGHGNRRPREQYRVVFILFFPSYIFGWPNKNCVPVSFLFCVSHIRAFVVGQSFCPPGGKSVVWFFLFCLFFTTLATAKKEPCGLAVKKKKVVAIFTIFLCVLFNGRKLKK